MQHITGISRNEQRWILVKRQATIGVSCNSWMLDSGWKRAETPRYVVGLEASADPSTISASSSGLPRIAGSARIWKVTLGTEQTARDLDAYADIHKLEDTVVRLGYYGAYMDAIFPGNWLCDFREALPERVPGSQDITTRNS
jgi:hypothetical protein